MKKIKVLSLCGVGLAALLVGCGGNDNPTTSNVPSQSVTTAPVPSTTIEPTQSTATSTTPAEPTDYLVKVVYAETNQPVLGTALKVQWCNSAGCKMPKRLDSNGVAKLPYTKGETYAIHLLNVPEGYTYNSYESVSNDANIETTMHIYKTGTKTGDGTEASPYIISTGYYNTTAVAQYTKQFYGITGLKAGEYTIESYAVSLDGKVDTIIGYYGTDRTVKPDQSGDNKGNDDNFKHTFTVTAEEENSTFYFVVLNSTNREAYSFSVTKTK